jgi:hypothetical protein
MKQSLQYFLIRRGRGLMRHAPARAFSGSAASARYTVLERLAAGAAASVHRAIEHAADGSQCVVALVLLRPELADDEVDQFVRQAIELGHAEVRQVGRGGTGWYVSLAYEPGSDYSWLSRCRLGDGSVDTELP